VSQNFSLSGPSDKVSVLDTTTSPPTIVTQAITPPGFPDGIAITPDGNYLYTANSNNTISQFNATSPFASIATAIAAGGGPPVLPSAQRTLSVCNRWKRNNVSMYAITAGTGVLAANGTIASGSGPTYPAICYNGNALLAAGLTFVANTAGAIGCTGVNPTFTGGTLKINGTGINVTQSFTLDTGGGTIDTNGNNAAFSGCSSEPRVSPKPARAL